MIIIVRAGLNIYQKINVCAKNLENKNPAGAIVAFITNIRSDILKLKVFEGELGREKHITDINNYGINYFPIKGELIAFDDEDEDVWEVINVLHDYPNHEINVFVKRYIWPDER